MAGPLSVQCLYGQVLATGARGANGTGAGLSVPNRISMAASSDIEHLK
jgi:hypothetical protein